MNKYLTIIFVLIILVTLSLTGCKKEYETTFEKIEDTKKMTFAMTGAYPPFNFIEKDGKIVGFDIDIANALAKKMGVEAKPITTAWDGIITGLQSGRFDTIIGSMAITEERLKQVNFSKPYYYDGAQFFTKKGSNLTSIKDLNNGKVGVVTGTTFHDELKKMDNVKTLQYESDVDNFMALMDGRSDGVVTGKFVGLQASKKYNMKPVGSLLYSEEIGIAVRKNDKKLLEKLNTALQEIIDDGTYENISKKWFGINILKK